MKSMNFFSGLTWGDLSRYKTRHIQTINKEKAEAMDKRIRGVLAQEKTYDWAVSALDFCAKEKSAASLDIKKYSREFDQLENIQKTAQKVIQDKKDADEKARRDAAKKADDAIDELNKAARNGKWCTAVNKLSAEVQQLSAQIRAYMQRARVLQQMVGEIPSVQKAEAFDKRVADVYKQTRSYSWAVTALEFCSKENATPQDVLKYSLEKDKLQQIEDAARTLIRQKQEADEKARRDAAKKADDAIDQLNKAVRNGKWCTAVTKLNTEVHLLSSQIHALMQRTKLLQQMVEEIPLVRKAEALDKRIADVYKQTRSYTWAVGALEFCSKENTTPQNVLKYSLEKGKLQEMENAAKTLIREKNERDEKALQDAAREADSAIHALQAADRNGDWCAKVTWLEASVQKLSAAVRARMENTAELQKMVSEIPAVRSAEAMDKRIREVLAQERTYSWAKKALDFCSQEEAAATWDILKYSLEAEHLKDIREAAQQLIQQKKDADEKALQDAARKADDTIIALSGASRSTYWCAEVADFDKEVKAMTRQVRTRMKKLSLLDQLVTEKDRLLKIEALENDIRKLLSNDNKDAGWLRAAEAYVHAGPNSETVRLVQDKALMEQLKTEYWRVFRAPTVKKYSDMLSFLEKSLWGQQEVRTQFHILDGEQSALDFPLSTYISHFETRWENGKEKVLAEEKRLEEAEKARKLAEKIQKEKDELQVYLDCLGDIAVGRASRKPVRDEFNRLNATVGKLKFDPETYHPGFRSKWQNAAKKVVDAQKADYAAAEKTRKEAEERARIAREDACRRAAKQQRKENVKTFFGFVLLLVLSLALGFAGTALLADSQLWFATAYVLPLCALLYIHLTDMDKYKISEFPHVLMQIMFYIACVCFGLFFDQSIVCIILSAALVALLFNGNPHILDCSRIWMPTWLRVLFTVIVAAIVIAGLGIFYPFMMGLSLWNSVWLLPLIALAVMILTAITIGDEEGLYSGGFGLLVLLHGVAYGFTLGNPVMFVGCTIIIGIVLFVGLMVIDKVVKSE